MQSGERKCTRTIELHMDLCQKLKGIHTVLFSHSRIHVVLRFCYTLTVPLMLQTKHRGTYKGSLWSEQERDEQPYCSDHGPSLPAHIK